MNAATLINVTRNTMKTQNSKRAKVERDLITSAIRTRSVGSDFARRLGKRAATGRRVILCKAWSRDCDCVESSYMIVLPATRKAYEAKWDNMQRNAEGPFSLHVMCSHDALDFAPSFRDRVLEAFENGNHYNV